MSAAIVYEGVPGVYEGTLFNGLKFYIHSQVPLRQSFVEKLKSNGGKVVELESKADVLIGDPMRPKKAPMSSISYKYIEDCVREGKLLNIESPKYRVHIQPQRRPGVSSNGGKKTRNAFTPEEDTVLVKWVVQQRNAGYATKGNVIYERLLDKLNAENSVHKDKHTAQSWRDRWVNKFDSLPLSSLASYLEAPDSPRRAPPAAGPPMSSHAAPRRADVSQPTSLVHRLQQQRDSPKKRVPFTEEEDARLKEYVEDRVRAGARAFGNKIYQEFEEENPSHSWQSWLNRYKLLVGRSSTHQDVTREYSQPTPRREDRIPRDLHPRQTPTSLASPGTPSEIGEWEHSPVMRGPPAPVDQPPANEPRVKIEPDETVQLPDLNTDVTKAKNLFHNRLKSYHKFKLVEHYTTIEITVGKERKVLHLWDLWNAARNHQSDHTSRDWKKIAEVMEDCPITSDVADKLKSAYEEHLLQFEQLLRETDIQRANQQPGTPDGSDEEEDEEEDEEDGEDEDEDEEDEHEEDQDNGEDEEDEENASTARIKPVPVVPDSSFAPPIPRPKRHIGEVELSSDPDSLNPAPKRRRYSPTREIACSPEITRHVPLPTTQPALPQLLPPAPQETPERAKAVLASIENDPFHSTPSQQQAAPGRFEPASSDSDSEDFDPPVNKPVPGPSAPRHPPAIVQEPRRRTLPKAWANPVGRSPTERSNVYSPGNRPSSSGSRSSVAQRLQLPLHTQPPPSSRSVSGAYDARSSTNPQAARQSSRAMSTSTRISTDPSSNKPDQAVIENFIRLGYDEETVLDALAATTNDVEVATQVMDNIKDGKGIPTNLAGVWTSRDDKALRKCHEVASGKSGGDPEKARDAVQERERLIKKHTMKRCRARAKHLGYMPWS